MHAKHLLLLTLLASLTQAQTPAKPTSPPTLRSTLLAQLHTTHDLPEWFTPINPAVANLTPEQAKWIPTNSAGKLDPDANHSVGMLANHLLFYNTHALARIQNLKPDPDPTNNEETFNSFDAASWSKIVQGLDTNMAAIEHCVEQASPEELDKKARLLADLATHNAYHTGQILYVRKLQGAWNPANGVK